MNYGNTQELRIKLKQKPTYAFNLMTGFLRKLKEPGELIGSWEIYVWNEPKSNCKKCYGRGYIGKNVKTHLKVSCNCLYKTKPKFF